MVNTAAGCVEWFRQLTPHGCTSRFKPIVGTAIALLLVSSVATARGFSPMTTYPRSTQTAGKYAAMTTSAYLGELTSVMAVSAVFLGVGALAKLDLSNRQSLPFRQAWIAVLVPAIPAGSAWGAYLVGRSYGWDGKFLAAGLGGLVGLGGGALVVLEGQQSNSPIGLLPWYIAASLLPPLGATIGYNLSCSPWSYGSRFLPGSVALGSVRDAYGTARPSIDVRLLSVRL